MSTQTNGTNRRIPKRFLPALKEIETMVNDPDLGGKATTRMVTKRDIKYFRLLVALLKSLLDLAYAAVTLANAESHLWLIQKALDYLSPIHRFQGRTHTPCQRLTIAQGVVHVVVDVCIASDLDILRLQVKDVARFRLEMEKKIGPHMKVATAKGKFVDARKFLFWLVAQAPEQIGHLAPTIENQHIEKTETGTGQPVMSFTVDQFLALRRFFISKWRVGKSLVDFHWWNYFDVKCGTGLRGGEMRRLRIGDVNLRERTLTVRENVDSPAEGDDWDPWDPDFERKLENDVAKRGERTVSLTPLAIRALRRQLRLRKKMGDTSDESLLFVKFSEILVAGIAEVDEESITKMNEAMCMVAARRTTTFERQKRDKFRAKTRRSTRGSWQDTLPFVTFEWHWHQCRHFALTMMLWSNGMNTRFVMDQAGHKNIDQSIHYTRRAEEFRRSLQDKRSKNKLRYWWDVPGTDEWRDEQRQIQHDLRNQRKELQSQYGTLLGNIEQVRENTDNVLDIVKQRDLQIAQLQARNDELFQLLKDSTNNNTAQIPSIHDDSNATGV